MYSVEITRQSKPTILTFRRPCNELTSVWSMFPCNTTLFSKQKSKSKIDNPKTKLNLIYVNEEHLPWCASWFNFSNICFSP